MRWFPLRRSAIFMRALVPLATLIGLAMSAPGADTIDVSAAVPTTSHAVDLRLWLPPNVATLRGVVICGPGLNSDFRSYAQDANWRILAQRHAFALVGLHWSSGNPNELDDDNDLKALEDGLAAAGTASGHAELARVPVAIWGMSASSGYAVHFSQGRTSRCIAFAHNKGASIGQFPFGSGDDLAVPGLLCYGETDAASTVGIIKDLFDYYRGMGALWALVPDWGMGHDQHGYGQYLAMVFFDRVIEQRLPKDYRAGTTASLVALQEADGWLGDNTTISSSLATTIKRSSFTGSADQALTMSWLPDDVLAAAWSAAATKNRAFNVGSPIGQRSVDNYATGTAVSIAGSASAGATVTGIAWLDGGTALGAPASPFSQSFTVTYGLHPVFGQVTTAAGPSITGFPLLCGAKGPDAPPSVGVPAGVSPANPTPGVAATVSISAMPGDGGLAQLLTYTWSVTGTPPGTAVFADINGTNAGSSLTATFPVAGVYQLQVEIRDAQGQNTIRTLTLTAGSIPATVAPLITSTAMTTATSGTAYAYDVSASGDPAPTYALDTAPSGMTIDAVTGLIAWTPSMEGSFAVTVRATNGILRAATQSFNVVVTSGGSSGGGSSSDGGSSSGGCGLGSGLAITLSSLALLCFRLRPQRGQARS